VYSIVQEQETPLHCAAGNDHSDTARVLVEAKANIHACNVVCMCWAGRGWVGGWVSGGVGGRGYE